jgi:hypothetical protein
MARDPVGQDVLPYAPADRKSDEGVDLRRDGKPMIKSLCRRVTTQHDQVNGPTSGARLICDMAGRGDRLESL